MQRQRLLYAYSSLGGELTYPAKPKNIRTPEGVVLNAEEVFLLITTGDTGCADVELEVELQLSIL